jgi:desulfoferrodoxin (superoxide reductase-like protein)
LQPKRRGSKTYYHVKRETHAKTERHIPVVEGKEPAPQELGKKD